MKDEKKTQEPKIRKCFVLRETPISLSELKAGDMFRVEGETRFYVASKDPIPEGVPGNFVVDAEQVSFARCFNYEQLGLRTKQAVQPAPAVEQSKKVVKLKGKNK